MNRTRKLITALIILLPVLVVVVVGALHILSEYRRLVANADRIFQYELSRMFDREVKIGEATITPFGTAVLNDVKVAAGRKLANGTMFEAKEIRVSYFWRGLLLRRLGAQSVRSVKVIDPRIVLVRRKNGTFNIQDLLKPPTGKPGPPFEGTVRIVGGRLIFHDYYVSAKSGPVTTELEDLQAFVDAAGYPTYTFTGSADSNKQRFTTARFAGRYNSNTKSFQIDVNAKNVNAPFAAQYAPLPKNVQVLAGKLDVVAGVGLDRSGKKPRITLNGTAEIAGGRITVPKISEPVSNIKGRVVLLNQRAIMSLRASVAGSAADLTGTVSNFQNPTLNLALKAPSVDYGRAVQAVEFLGGLSQLNPRGSGPLTARITGTLAKPVVDLNASIPQLVIQGYIARDVSVSGTYKPGRFNLGRARFRAFGGQVVASGTIDLTGTPSLSITGRATSVNLSGLPLPQNLQATGEASGSFQISGPIQNPGVTVNANIPGGTINNVPFGSASGRFTYRGGEIRIAQLVINQIEGGTIRVAGDVSLNRLDLIVEARGVQVERFAEIIGQPGLQGVVFFEGRVRGRPQAPMVTGKLEIFQARLRDVGIEYARVTLTGEGRQVRVSDAVIRFLPGEVRFSGTLDFLASGNIGFDGRAAIQRLTVDKLASLLGLEEVPVSGVIEGDLQASGVYVPGAGTLATSFLNTTASGQVRIADATAFGYPVQTATLEVSLANNVLNVDRAVVASQDAELVMTGNVSLETGLVDLAYTLSDFHLSRLRDYLGAYADVGGVLAATGRVYGPLEDVRVTMQADATDLVINNQQYGQAQLVLAYEDGVVDSLALTLTRNDLQRLVVTLDDYVPATNCVASARAVINEASVPLLWSVLVNSPYLRTEQGRELRDRLQELPALTGGSISGTSTFTGCLDQLNGSAALTVTDLALDDRRIESVAVDASVANGIITLDQFSAVSEETTLVADGTLSLTESRIDLNVNAQNFDLTKLRPWLGANTPNGTLAAEFIVQGDLASPLIKGSVEVVNPAFGGLQFERFRISTIEVQQNKIVISDAILASDGYQIEGQGTLPWDWATMAIPADEPISFTAGMKEQDLSVLASFIPMVNAEGTSGPINANLQISGTLANPNLTGGVTLTNGNLALTNLENQFTDIGVDLAFMGNRIVFNQLVADSSLGGSIRVVPGGVIDLTGAGAGQVNLLVVANGLVIAEKNLFGLQETVKTQIDAGLSVTGDLTSPLVADASIPGASAGVRLSNAQLTFVVPEGMVRPERAAFGINPRFDVSLSVGPDVVVSPPNISLSVNSTRGSLKGTLSDPVLDLALEILEGDIRLAGRRLRVEPGGMIYVQYSAANPPEVRFDFDAVTNVFATSPLGGRERYEIIMHVGGTLDNLQVTLESSPPGLSQEQMLAALGHVEGIFTSGEAQLEQELVNVLGALGTQTIFAPIESLFVERFGFEAFTLEYQPGQPIALYASANVFGNYFVSVYWRLTSNFAAVNPSEWQFTFSYRFRRLYNFYVGIDNQQVYTVGAGYTNYISW